jgi:hypothetical protein
MIDFGGYTYDDHKAALACQHVQEGSPVLLFVHDEDGDIHFMCGASGHNEDDLVVIDLSHMLEQMRSMSPMPIVDPGFLAERGYPGARWTVTATQA